MSIASLYPSINPSLLLDFANVKRLDPRITFTRTTTATYYDGVTTAKAEENLFTYSQNSTTNWTNFSSRLTITTSYEAAPDGTTTGMRLVNSSGSTGYFYQNVGSNILVSGTTYTLSVYVKSNTGSSQTISLMIPDTGTTTNVTATTTWSRVSWTPTLASTNSFAGLVLSNGADISVWGFQLEQRSSATAYTATTTQAITNYIPVLQTAAAGQARFDHNPTTGESLGLLIEEARTNLLTYSQQLTLWNNASSAVVVDNAVVSPDGTIDASTFTDTTASSQHYMTKNATVVSGTSYTFSVYVKSYQLQGIALRIITATTVAQSYFNLSAGTITVSAGTATITNVGNGWYRCTLTGIADSTTAAVYINLLQTPSSTTLSYSGTGTGLFIWGAQLEAGSFATSYIPTVASSVTRNADAASMTGTNFSSWFNNGEGTLFAEASTSAANTAKRFAQIDSGAESNRIQIAAESSGTTKNFAVVTNSSTQAYTPVSASYPVKVGAGYKVNDFGASFNGGAIQTDTSGTVPALSVMRFGAAADASENMNGCLRKVSYYPAKATSAQIVGLTT